MNYNSFFIYLFLLGVLLLSSVGCAHRMSMCSHLIGEERRLCLLENGVIAIPSDYGYRTYEYRDN